MHAAHEYMSCQAVRGGLSRGRTGDARAGGSRAAEGNELRRASVL